MVDRSLSLPRTVTFVGKGPDQLFLTSMRDDVFENNTYWVDCQPDRLIAQENDTQGFPKRICKLRPLPDAFFACLQNRSSWGISLKTTRILVFYSWATTGARQSASECVCGSCNGPWPELELQLGRRGVLAPSPVRSGGDAVAPRQSCAVV